MSTDKKAFRARMLAQRKLVSAEQKQYCEQEMTRRVLELPVYQQARSIFVYFSVGDELSTMALIDDALRCGKVVCIPRCEPGRQMAACAVSSLEDLTLETYGIPEPGRHCEVIEPEQLDLCIVPALACDRCGYRMGYGGGYYDRFLPRTPAQKLVLCTADRLFDEIPHEVHDISCDLIVTENEVYVIS